MLPGIFKPNLRCPWQTRLTLKCPSWIKWKSNEYGWDGMGFQVLWEVRQITWKLLDGKWFFSQKLKFSFDTKMVSVEIGCWKGFCCLLKCFSAGGNQHKCWCLNCQAQFLWVRLLEVNPWQLFWGSLRLRKRAQCLLLAFGKCCWTSF